MRFAFVHAEKAVWPVTVMCEVLCVSRSGYYAWRDRPASAHDQTDAKLLVEIKAAHEAGRGYYGSPRVHRALRNNGTRVSRKRVTRLMKDEGIAASGAVLNGSPFFAINDATRPGDLIVLTSHGRGGVRRWLLGSVAEKLVREASVPVLLVPAVERGRVTG